MEMAQESQETNTKTMIIAQSADYLVNCDTRFWLILEILKIM